MARLVIFGTGDIGKLAYYYFTHDSPHEVVAFTVDQAYRHGDNFLDLPVVDFEEVVDRYPPAEYQMFIAISYARMNRVRASKYAQAKALGYKLASYISSRCTFLTEYEVGDNCFILEDNTIQPFVRIGNNVTLWSGNHIGHESTIGDHVFIASHVVVSGHCNIGSYCFIGVNATLRNSITVAPETLIGAGAIIMKNTVEKGVYIPQHTDLFHKKSDEIKL
jgi:sugar O-acyltransferase (sialic acid O-acetyltransferase NeuD family)